MMNLCWRCSSVGLGDQILNSWCSRYALGYKAGGVASVLLAWPKGPGSATDGGAKSLKCAGLCFEFYYSGTCSKSFVRGCVFERDLVEEIFCGACLPTDACPKPDKQWCAGVGLSNRTQKREMLWLAGSDNAEVAGEALAAFLGDMQELQASNGGALVYQLWDMMC